MMAALLKRFARPRSTAAAPLPSEPGVNCALWHDVSRALEANAAQKPSRRSRSSAGTAK